MAKYIMIGACEGKPIFKQEYKETPEGLMFLMINSGAWAYSEFDSIQKAFEYYSKQYDILTTMQLPD